MLTIEIENLRWDERSQHPCPGGTYSYVVKVNRREIGRGSVELKQTKHWSLLLEKIADDAHRQEFLRVMSD